MINRRKMGNHPITKSKIARGQREKMQIMKSFYRETIFAQKEVFWGPFLAFSWDFFSGQPQKTNNIFYL